MEGFMQNIPMFFEKFVVPFQNGSVDGSGAAGGHAGILLIKFFLRRIAICRALTATRLISSWQIP